MQLFPKLLSGMANCVDPDLTAPSGAVLSGSKLFVYAILSEIFLYEILRYLLYHKKDIIFSLLILHR